MNIRELTDLECAVAAQLALEVFNMHVAPHYTDEGRKTFEIFSSPHELCVRSQTDHETFGAFEEGALLGMMHLKRRTHISMLFVRSTSQRSGIGRSLVRFAEARSDAGLTVNSSPNSVRAYESYGFAAFQPEQCIHGIRFIPMRKGKRN